MPRTVPPTRWQTFDDLLRAGRSVYAAARIAQISEPCARLFMRERRSRNLAPDQRRSSGWRWVEAQESAHDEEPAA